MTAFVIRRSRIINSLFLSSSHRNFCSGRSVKAVISPERERAYKNFFHHEEKSAKRKRILLYSLCTIGVVGFIGWYFYWPHHTFSSPVAKVLRKALWAESIKENFDYKKALGLYYEALEVANDEKLDQISDEYTGIELKIGEMYEKLGDSEAASEIYHEISARYLQSLNDPSIDSELKGHLIQKDLRLVTKYASLNEKSSASSYLQSFVFTHLLKAMDEVMKRLGASGNNVFDPNIDPALASEVLLVTDFSNNEKSANKDYTLTVGESGAFFTGYPLIKSKWLPFREEFFNVRDLFVSICNSRSTKEYKQIAAAVQLCTTQWMPSAGFELVEILNSINSCGSMLYLRSETYEALALTENQAENQENSKHLMNEASKWYKCSVRLCNSVPSTYKENNPELSSAMALSLYSLGVIELHIGNVEKSKALLVEARLKGRAVGFYDLVAECDNELSKLKKIVDKSEDSN
ncbi:Mgr3 protein [Saccharomycopsis crataegensis]|uniref:Mgr3 protein n=1 Tax=Saccharomycopsis crataegensis TaxID=43959 RepID=A0AAV5QHP6_9ASCO|nr:Mgr3 protein [Saccharomycopsis crataegensis]